MSVELTTALLFGSMVLLLALGLPIAFGLGGVGLVFAIFMWGPGGLFMVLGRTLGLMHSLVLIAIPLFVLMANFLERSGIADDLYVMMYRWMGPLRGGLAMGTVVICTIFAAMSGVSATGTVTMGIVALPSLLKRKYDKSISLGCIMAGGALGQLIPPSVLMVVYGMFAGVSVGALFMGGVFPGLLLSFLFICYIGIRCGLNPSLGPTLPAEERSKWKEKFLSLRAVILPMLLVIGVLGSIFLGVATPTEAAAVGAIGSLVCSAINHKLSWQMVKEACYRTLRITGMIMWIVIGAMTFVSVYYGIGAPQLIQHIAMAFPVNRWLIIIAIQVTLFVLGCFIGPLEILMLTVPVYVPIIEALGFDPLWFGILFIVNMEMAYLTPPFGANLFYLKGVVPESITMGDLYYAVWPFVGVQALGLVIVMVFPQVATWFPSQMIKV